MTNEVNHVMSNIAFACSQRYTESSVLRLAQITLCLMTLRKFTCFVRHIISNALTDGLVIPQ